jgi:hypothetical protein
MLNVWSSAGAFMEKVADTWSFALQEIRMHVVIVSRVFLLLLGREVM